jgi:hypothetical protein
MIGTVTRHYREHPKSNDTCCIVVYISTEQMDFTYGLVVFGE